jgi:pyruvate/2-oxoglutarate/acetoin dehydrogenase E1 component
MRLVNHVNSLILKEIESRENIVLFGQNISAGSCLGGLTKDIKESNSSTIINTQNSENTLVGVGFGLMLNEVSSVFFMKQMDFLLLGVDHLVNTYNILRQKDHVASFTIMPIVVDSGYEGPQSSLNNFDDFCSIGGVEGFSFTNKVDAEKILSRYLIKPGFRIISPSQRLLKEKLLDLNVLYHDKESRIFQYRSGNGVTIVCFNYSLPYGCDLGRVFDGQGIQFSLFSVNAQLNVDYNRIIEDLHTTKNLILIDDTKSINRSSDKLMKVVNEECELRNKIIVTRDREDDYYFPRQDLMKIDYQSILDTFSSNN